MADNRRKTDIRLIIYVGATLVAVAGAWFTLKGDVEAVQEAYADVKDTPKQIAVMQKELDGHIKNFDEDRRESKARDDKMLDLLYQIKRNGNGTNN